MLGWFAETTLVASALAVVAALVGRVRPIGPTARHVLWLAVLVKLMAPPLVSWPWAVPREDWYWPSLSCGAEPVAEPPAVAAVEDDDSPSKSPACPAAIETVAGLLVTCPQAATVEAEPAEATCPSVPCEPEPAPTAPITSVGPGPTLMAAWLVVTGLLAAVQGWRILRFRRRLRLAVPAPDDLVEEAARIAEQLGGRAPELLVVPELGTPMLWCLGRPRLLLPAHLVKTMDRDRWRGILVHELAHLRRGDHWVSRLELLAGLFWWWNPLYWLTRARLDAEAELACDAWVVWALPKDRLAYAETLFDIGSALSRAASPAPALGAAGSGRFLERRLIMILHERIPCRPSPLVLLVALLLVVLALPSWSAAAKPPLDPPATVAALATTAHPVPFVSVADDDDKDEADDDDDDDDDDDADDDDDDDDDDAKAKKAVAKAERDKARAERDKARAERQEARAKRAEAKEKGKAVKKAGGKKAESDIEAEIEKTLGPDFEKKMEAFGERIAKEMEEKFGPDFEKKMEKFGKEMEEKFGPEFQKKMEKLGKELEEKLGPGSDFEKKMKELGKEMEAKFGPGSDFERSMKKLGEEMGSKFGPGSDFEKKMKELGEKAKQKAADGAKAGRDAKEAPKARATARKGRREARIAALEAQIRKLSQELRALEAEGDEDER